METRGKNKLASLPERKEPVLCCDTGGEGKKEEEEEEEEEEEFSLIGLYDNLQIASP